MMIQRVGVKKVAATDRKWLSRGSATFVAASSVPAAFVAVARGRRVATLIIVHYLSVVL